MARSGREKVSHTSGAHDQRLGIAAQSVYQDENGRGFAILRSIPFLLCLLVAGCGGLPGDRTVVTGTDADELLKLRAGPGLGFKVILGLPEGTALNRRDCVTELGQLWCRVSLQGAPSVSGYVSADYLSDS